MHFKFSFEKDNNKTDLINGHTICWFAKAGEMYTRPKEVRFGTANNGNFWVTFGHCHKDSDSHTRIMENLHEWRKTADTHTGKDRRHNSKYCLA